LFSRFWRGDYSLALSFWVIAPLMIALAFVLPEGVGYVVRAQDFNPFLILGAIVAIWGIVVVAQLYLIVGVWRSAANLRWDRAAKGKRSLWAIVAQGVLVVVALNLLRVFFHAAIPELAEGSRMALLDDPALPPYSMRLMRDGTEAEIAGGFKYGLARDAETLFASAPQLRVVHLNSAGGRLGEAIKLARMIRAHGYITYTSVSCASACTIAYAAGRERHLRAGARLGFHRGIFAGSENAEEMRRLLLAGGLEASFVERAVAQSPSSMWYPTDAELGAARVVTAIVDSYRYAASGFGAQGTLMVFEDALRQTPAIEVLETAEPRLFEEMAALYLQRYTEDRSAGEIEDELRAAKIAPFIANRLPRAEDDILVDYAHLYADQYAALNARDPAACFAFVTKGGDARLVALMGADLQRRELALTDRVMRSKGVRAPPLPAILQLANGAVYKTLSAQFGDETVRLLADPAKVQPAQYEPFCRLAIARFRAIAALPARQAGDLMSSIFDVPRPANR
jgi:hypothetical protein